MPSSISNSDLITTTARPLPTLHHLPVLGTALLVFFLCLGGWETYWRDYDVSPSIRNSDGLWATQWRRLQAAPESSVIVGSSRGLFDLQLDEWQATTGKRPIQLALEGSTPVPILEALAAESSFHGRVLVDVTPDLFFSGYLHRKAVLSYRNDETLSQRSGQWLSQNLLEPWLAFYDSDYALFTVLARQPWTSRDGKPAYVQVRKLSLGDADRNTYLWSKVEHDSDYRALARAIWAQRFHRPPPGGVEAARANVQTQIERAAVAVAQLRARQVPVVFLRTPSNGEYLAFEERAFPRTATWDALLHATAAPGIHFQDDAKLRGGELPDGSHLSRRSAQQFTRQVAPQVEALWRDAAHRRQPK